MFFYIKTLFNLINSKDLLHIRTGKKLIDKDFGNHHYYLESLYIDLENSYKDGKILLPKFYENEKINKVLISQYLSKNFNNFRFTNTILYSYSKNKKIALPIPSFWNSYFDKYNLSISRIGSYTLFLLQGLFKFLLCFRILYKLFKSSFNSKEIKLDNFFYDLSYLNLPYNNNFDDFTLYSDLVRNNVISRDDKSLIYTPRKSDLKKIIDKKSNNNLIITDLGFIHSLNKKKFLFLILKLIQLFFKALFYIFKNKLEYINFIQELFIYEIVKISNLEKLPNNIFYNNSSWKYKPLWTYYVENLGKKVWVYFYSLSERPYKKQNLYPRHLQGLYNLYWNNYIVWNKEHQIFLEKISKVKANYKLSGPLSLKDDNICLKNINFKKSIAVFIAAPYKKIFSMRFAMNSTQYRSYENIIKFTNDIFELAKKFDLNIIFKHKKTDQKQIIKKYKYSTQDFMNYPKTFLIDENISPKKYVDDCLCSISFPFSSTAFLTKNRKYSIFYDPTNSLFKDDEASYGIVLVNNRIELEKYIFSILSEI